MYQQLYALLVQIEAILNSRPITLISNNPSDLMTPTIFDYGFASDQF